MDGMEATQHIRQLGHDDPYYSRLPIIALTANAVSGMKEMFLKGGFDDYMSKPIDIPELNNVLLRRIPKDKHVYTEIDTNDNKNSADIEEDGSLIFTPNEIDGIDINRGLELTGGKIEYYLDALTSFHSDLFDRLDLLDNYIKEENLKDYVTNIHALKSAGANVGANELSKLAEELEGAGLSNDIDFIKENSVNFKSTARKLLANISVALEAYAAHGQAGIQNTDTRSNRDKAMHKMLRALKTALENIDIGSTNKTIDELMRLARTEDEKNAIREISKHILLFEYDEACALIDSFC
jgi:CheY-like chemotaxis protein